jgi:hypothetical protein
MGSANPVAESVNLLCELLQEILKQTSGSGVPIGVNVESLSIYKEEIDAAHDLFQKLQVFFVAIISLTAVAYSYLNAIGHSSKQYGIAVGR